MEGFMHRLLFALAVAISLATPLAAQSPEVPILVPEVIAVYPHDENAFTQGLLWNGGYLYESTGQWGQSTLRRVDIETGLPQEVVSLDDAYFTEGLERLDDTLIQLTWQAGLAFVYDFGSFELLDTLVYEGEGWGLCYDGRYLFMSDGSSHLSIRDPHSFELIFRGAVTYQGQLLPAQLLNELECVGEYVYANGWNTDYIFRIDKYTGVVIAVIDASALLTDAERGRSWATGQRAKRHRLQSGVADILYHRQELEQNVRSRFCLGMNRTAALVGQEVLTLLL